MKKIIAVFCFIMVSTTFAQTGSAKYGYISKEEQKYYKNEGMDGNNPRERIDSLVIETNKLYGKINSMENDIAELKQEIEKLKAAKK